MTPSFTHEGTFGCNPTSLEISCDSSSGESAHKREIDCGICLNFINNSSFLNDKYPYVSS